MDTELERPDPIALAVPVARPRPEWVRPFLDEYSKCGNVIAACDRVGIGLYKVRHYRRSSAWFTRKAREAKGRYVARLELLLDANAANGDTKAAKELLQRHDPKHYPRNSRGAGGTTNVNVYTPEQVQVLASISARLPASLSEVGLAALRGETLPYPGDTDLSSTREAR